MSLEVSKLDCTDQACTFRSTHAGEIMDKKMVMDKKMKAVLDLARKHLSTGHKSTILEHVGGLFLLRFVGSKSFEAHQRLMMNDAAREITTRKSIVQWIRRPRSELCHNVGIYTDLIDRARVASPQRAAAIMQYLDARPSASRANKDLAVIIAGVRAVLTRRLNLQDGPEKEERVKAPPKKDTPAAKSPGVSSRDTGSPAPPRIAAIGRARGKGLRLHQAKTPVEKENATPDARKDGHAEPGRMHASVEALAEEVRLKTARVEAMEYAHATLQSTVLRLETEKGETAKRVMDLEDTVFSLSTQKTRNEARIHDLEATVLHLETEKRETAKRVMDLEDTVFSLSTQKTRNEISDIERMMTGVPQGELYAVRSLKSSNIPPSTSIPVMEMGTTVMSEPSQPRAWEAANEVVNTLRALIIHHDVGKLGPLDFALEIIVGAMTSRELSLAQNGLKSAVDLWRHAGRSLTSSSHVKSVMAATFSHYRSSESFMVLEADQAMATAIEHGPRELVVSELLEIVSDKHRVVSEKASIFVDSCLRIMGVGQGEMAGTGLRECLDSQKLSTRLHEDMGDITPDGRLVCREAIISVGATLGREAFDEVLDTWLSPAQGRIVQQEIQKAGREPGSSYSKSHTIGASNASMMMEYAFDGDPFDEEFISCLKRRWPGYPLR